MEIPHDSFVGLKYLPRLPGRDVPHVTARMLPSPYPFLIYFAFLSGSSLTLTIQFILVYHCIHLQKSAKCQKSRKCKNMNSKQKKEIDVSVSKVNFPISESTPLDFIL